MNPSEERELYERDRFEWTKYAAPRVRAINRHADVQTKRDAWARCSDALRDEINRLAEIDRIERVGHETQNKT